MCKYEILWFCPVANTFLSAVSACVVFGNFKEYFAGLSVVSQPGLLRCRGTDSQTFTSQMQICNNSQHSGNVAGWDFLVRVWALLGRPDATFVCRGSSTLTKDRESYRVAFSPSKTLSNSQIWVFAYFELSEHQLQIISFWDTKLDGWTLKSRST